MTRSELYERVWLTPMSKLAPEFGVSDVALAKLCRKHSVPRPPRGYWAKIAAGKTPRRAKLPSPQVGGEIEVPGGDRTLAAQERNRRIEPPKVGMVDAASRSIAMQSTLTGCSPAVRRTADYFDAIKKKVDDQRKRDARPSRYGREPGPRFVGLTNSGRFHCGEDGCLSVIASLTDPDWILRFLEALANALCACGGELLPCSKKDGLGARVAFDGHSLEFSIAEGFDKVLPRTGSKPWVTCEFEPTSTYKLKVRRPPLRADRVWDVRRENLEDDVAAYAAKIAHVVREDKAAQAQRTLDEAERRARAEARAVESRAWFAAQERIGVQRRARKAQAERVLDVGEAQLRYEATLRVLGDLETRMLSGAEGEGLRVWMNVARAGLVSPTDVLFSELCAEVGKDERPDWWPEKGADDPPDVR